MRGNDAKGPNAARETLTVFGSTAVAAVVVLTAIFFRDRWFPPGERAEPVTVESVRAAAVQAGKTLRRVRAENEKVRRKHFSALPDIPDGGRFPYCGAMRQLTPLVTAVLVLLGLAGFVAFNSTRVQTTSGAAAAPPATLGTTSAAPVTTTTSRAAALPDEAVYAGKAENGKLAVAVAVKGGKAVAYLCDGARVEAWLTGSAKNGRIDVASANRNASLSASLEGDALTGTTKLGGSEYHFTVGLAKKPAGLYRNKNGTTTIGWIVLRDGSQVGVANVDGQETPAPPLDAASGTATVGGGPVDASPVSGEEEIG